MVRFGPEAVRMDTKLARFTPLAAGIIFRAGDQSFRCWVWGNSVHAEYVSTHSLLAGACPSVGEIVDFRLRFRIQRLAATIRVDHL